MENDKDDELKILEYQWTSNVIEKSKFHGIEKKNLVEAIIVSATVTLFIVAIPFTNIVKGMSAAVIVPVLFLVFVKGYKNRSIFQFIRDELKFKHRRRVSHLRGPEYKRKEKKQFESYEEFGFIESVIAKSKQRLDDFIEKYDTNNSSQNS